MADEKKARPERKARALTDRKRLSYLKIRYGELRKESQAIKTEMAALRGKVGGAKKGKAGANDEGDDD